MSFDVTFLPAPADGDWDAAIDAQEARAEGESRPPTDADRARFAAVEAAVRSVLPDVTTFEGGSSRQLDHEPSGIQVSTFTGDPGEIAVTVPYWYDEDRAAPIVEILRRLATAIEAATGLVAYDPQAGGPFLGHGEQHAGAAFGQIDRLARRRGWRRR